MKGFFNLKHRKAKIYYIERYMRFFLFLIAQLFFLPASSTGISPWRYKPIKSWVKLTKNLFTRVFQKNALDHLAKKKQRAHKKQKTNL